MGSCCVSQSSNVSSHPRRPSVNSTVAPCGKIPDNFHGILSLSDPASLYPTSATTSSTFRNQISGNSRGNAFFSPPIRPPTTYICGSGCPKVCSMQRDPAEWYVRAMRRTMVPQLWENQFLSPECVLVLQQALLIAPTRSVLELFSFFSNFQLSLQMTLQPLLEHSFPFFSVSP
ncbi:MAG: hypothetical protein RBG13Loki_0559 [Promethearchaeota archaeon CR_4]|nr:MAG: hypothetical protein RBG13Loki_0559 [Candidatus Lokiarchaeota archaeon CR_4]